MLTPTLSHLQNRNLQLVWFASWNGANRRAREAYDLRVHELDLKEGAVRRWHDRQKAREMGVLPEECRQGLHKLAEVGVSWEKRGYWKCRGCINEKSTAKRRAKGIQAKPPRFSPEQAADLRRRYDAGATLSELAVQEGASVNGVQTAIRKAGGTFRRPIDTKRLRRQLGVDNASGNQHREIR